MNYTQYYENQITEKIDQAERRLWQEFYTKRLPKRTEKFKRKYTGKPEELPKAIEEFEARTAGEYSEVIDEKLTTICGDMREKFYHEILAKLDQLSAGMPDKADSPKLDKQTIASEIIADQKNEIEKLKIELQEAERNRDFWHSHAINQTRKLDAINFVTQLYGEKTINLLYGVAKSSFQSQEKEKLENEQEVSE